MTTARAVIDLDVHGDVISHHLYGHIAEHLGRCIYGGFWVGEDSAIPNVRGIRSDVVEALRALGIPNLRWPGGCFADDYHWRDGIGPRESRPTMVNTHWGDVVENNHFGTHEFMDLCDLLGADAYARIRMLEHVDIVAGDRQRFVHRQFGVEYHHGGHQLGDGGDRPDRIDVLAVEDIAATVQHQCGCRLQPGIAFEMREGGLPGIRRGR